MSNITAITARHRRNVSVVTLVKYTYDLKDAFCKIKKWYKRKIHKRHLSKLAHCVTDRWQIITGRSYVMERNKRSYTCTWPHTDIILISFAKAFLWLIARSLPLKMYQDYLFESKSTLDQSMVWCWQATRHYLVQIWARLITPRDTANSYRSQRVNSSWHIDVIWRHKT